MTEPSEPSPAAAPPLRCPFCGAAESDRLTIDGRRFVVFACMFTPEVDPAASDEVLAERLRTDYAGRGGAYFRGMCDRLHLSVTTGPAAEALRRSAGSP
jgi:hypothetical protein